MNFKINKILTPVDFSETSLQALDHAVFMAQLFNARLSFIHVMERLNYTDEFGMPTEAGDKVNSLISAKLGALALSVHKEHGIIKPEIILEEGNIADGIVHAAAETGADIIIMGTHGVSGWKEFFVGSNAYKVVTRASCPVLTVQKHSNSKGFRKIMLPIDSSAPSRQKVVHAVEFAKRYGSIVHVAALITEDEPEVRGKFDVMIRQVNDFLDKNEVAYENKILTGSNIAKMTMQYAEEVNADIIMIMTEQEENLTGLIVGPYAQQVVNHSHIPVLSITPQETFHTQMVHPY